MDKHTPGPWHVSAGAVDNPRLIVENDLGLSVCALSLRGVQGDTKKMEANAHLIAAAPELLEALKLVRAYLSKCPPHGEDITGDEWGRVMDLSGAALIKATGGQP